MCTKSVETCKLHNENIVIFSLSVSCTIESQNWQEPPNRKANRFRSRQLATTQEAGWIGAPLIVTANVLIHALISPLDARSSTARNARNAKFALACSIADHRHGGVRLLSRDGRRDDWRTLAAASVRNFYAF